jgi:iron complex outermembrane recepter protein
VGDVSANEQANPGVAFNVDGVYVGRPQAVAATFYDVERVEVLKGPQGTLYGRNASGGAINLITNKPTFSGSSGYVTLEAGNFDLKHVNGAVNVPLNSELAVRGAFDVVDRNGYLSDGTDDDKHAAGRIHVLWAPEEALSILTTLDYAHTRGEGPGFALNPRPAGASPWTAGNSPLGLQQLASYLPLGPLLVQNMNFVPYVDNTSINASVELKYDMSWSTLTVLPAHRDFRDNELNFVGFHNEHHDHASETTFEARLNHENDQAKWVAGSYFYDESLTGHSIIQQGIVQNSQFTFRPAKTRAYAAFGQISYSVVDDLRVIGGVRYTTERRDLNGGATSTVLTPVGFATSMEPYSGVQTFNSTTWKAGLEYDVAANNMLFFTASTGFKAGGLNQEPAPGNAYQPEKLTAYELGTRNRFLNDRLQINAELFHWDYKNHQEGVITFDNTGAPNFLIENAGAATLYGGSLDIQARVTSADTFRVYGEYNHARYDSFSVDTAAPLFNPASTACSVGPVHLSGGFLPIVTLNCAGFQLARAPTWTGSTSLDHHFDLPNGAALVAGASAQFSASRWASVDFIPEERASSYVVGNFDLNYTSPGGRWMLAAFVHNLSNAFVVTGGTIHQFAPPEFYETVNPPRTYGGRFSVNF